MHTMWSSSNSTSCKHATSQPRIRSHTRYQSAEAELTWPLKAFTAHCTELTSSGDRSQASKINRFLLDAEFEDPVLFSETDALSEPPQPLAMKSVAVEAI